MEKSIAHFCRKVSVDGSSFYVLLTQNEAKEGKRGLIKVDVYRKNIDRPDLYLFGSGVAVKNPCDKWNRKTGVSIAAGRSVPEWFNAYKRVPADFRKKFVNAVLKAYNV